jgi:hypothetical protein
MPCTNYEPKSLSCDFPRHIFYLFSGIYASGLIGLPWDVFVLWATKVFPDNSSMLKDTKFQVAVFGFLSLNIWQILAADYVIEGIMILKLYDTNLIEWYMWQNMRPLVWLLREFFIFSLIAKLILIPQFVQLMSTAAFSVFVYQNQLGV